MPGNQAIIVATVSTDTELIKQAKFRPGKQEYNKKGRGIHSKKTLRIYIVQVSIVSMCL